MADGAYLLHNLASLRRSPDKEWDSFLKSGNRADSAQNPPKLRYRPFQIFRHKGTLCKVRSSETRGLCRVTIASRGGISPAGPFASRDSPAAPRLCSEPPRHKRN